MIWEHLIHQIFPKIPDVIKHIDQFGRYVMLRQKAIFWAVKNTGDTDFYRIKVCKKIYAFDCFDEFPNSPIESEKSISKSDGSEKTTKKKEDTLDEKQ